MQKICGVSTATAATVAGGMMRRCTLGCVSSKCRCTCSGFEGQIEGFTKNIMSLHVATDSLSERLRRWTRSPLGSDRRDSNSLAVAFCIGPVGLDQEQCASVLRESFNLSFKPWTCTSTFWRHAPQRASSHHAASNCSCSCGRDPAYFLHPVSTRDKEEKEEDKEELIRSKHAKENENPPLTRDTCLCSQTVLFMLFRRFWIADPAGWLACSPASCLLPSYYDYVYYYYY